jgi:hypothetical protein
MKSISLFVALSFMYGDITLLRNAVPLVIAIFIFASLAGWAYGLQARHSRLKTNRQTTVAITMHISSLGSHIMLRSTIMVRL